MILGAMSGNPYSPPDDIERDFVGINNFLIATTRPIVESITIENIKDTGKSLWNW